VADGEADIGAAAIMYLSPSAGSSWGTLLGACHRQSSPTKFAGSELNFSPICIFTYSWWGPSKENVLQCTDAEDATLDDDFGGAGRLCW